MNNFLVENESKLFPEKLKLFHDIITVQGFEVNI